MEKVKQIIPISIIILKTENRLEALRQHYIYYFRLEHPKGNLSSSVAKKLIENSVNSELIIPTYGEIFHHRSDMIYLNLKLIFDDEPCEQDAIDHIIKTISHETLHSVIALNEGRHASHTFDNIYRRLRNLGYII